MGCIPVCRILMRTSLAFGGATSTSSILSSSPAPQHTAALHVITLPTVSAIGRKFELRVNCAMSLRNKRKMQGRKKESEGRRCLRLRKAAWEDYIACFVSIRIPFPSPFPCTEVTCDRCTFPISVSLIHCINSHRPMATGN